MMEVPKKLPLFVSCKENLFYVEVVDYTIDRVKNLPNIITGRVDNACLVVYVSLKGENCELEFFEFVEGGRMYFKALLQNIGRDFLGQCWIFTAKRKDDSCPIILPWE